MSESTKNGEGVVDESHGTPEERKNFAREIMEFLRQRVSDPVQVSRIFKAAGPGQVKEAWKLATSQDWTKDEDAEVRKDILDCILKGAGGAQKFGQDRMADVLDELGFYVPTSFNSTCFFRTLAGALEILVPGSFRFSSDELREIETARRSQVQYNLSLKPDNRSDNKNESDNKNDN